MKKIKLLLCMIICIFAMSACSNGTDVTPVAEEEALKISVTSMLMTYGEYSDEDLAAYGENALAGGYEQISNMLNSLLSARAEAGAYRSVDDDWKIVYGEGTAEITVTTQFEKRPVVLRMKLSQGEDNPESLDIDSASFNPVYSVWEKLRSAAANSLFGIGTVAVILMLMVGVISCFRFIPMLEAKYAVWSERRAEIREKKKAQKAKLKEQKRRAKLGLPEEDEVQETVPVKSAAADAAVQPETENPAADLELIAVITAAIAAMEGVPADGLVVRSIRRSPGRKWNRV